MLPVVSLCGLASLLAFQKAMQFFTGKEISLVATVRTVLIELGYYVAFVVTLSLVIMIVLSLIEFWPILGPDYFLTVFMGTEG
ncbi:hypothetical protein [Marinobacterium aestuariivivens]|uniref:ABC3 transporter permease protein domain-containing protein n=1 Tax=Marinobacterium aestuariivivens TaxID=1698799 RepID=A0ABW2AAC1_9GAMM